MPAINISLSVREIGNKSAVYDVKADLNGEATLIDFLKFTKRALLEISLDTLKREQSNGFDKDPVVKVDGSLKKNIFDVSPLGKIEYISSEVSSLEIIRKTYESIISLSKVVTGTYIEGNFIFFNDKVVATDLAEMEQWLATKPKMAPGDTIRFVNVVPYARRLEGLGITSGTKYSNPSKRRRKGKAPKKKGHVSQANGVYFLSSRAASRSFKDNILIRFEFILGSTLGVQEIPTIAKNGKALRRNYATPPGQKPTRKNSGPYLYPSIKMTIREKGTTS